MALQDIREYLAVLEQRGLVRRVSEEVDPSWEIGCMVKWGFQGLAEDDRFGFLFDNVKGHSIPVAAGALGASEGSYAIGLGVEPHEINAKWEEALCHPIAPVMVDTAPCQEVVVEGGDIDLGSIPVPVWTPGKDAGPYVTGIVVTSDAVSGIQNYGVYRTQVLGPDRMVSNLGPGRQGTKCVQSWHNRGEPAPIAFVIGAEPAMYYAAVTSLPFAVDEATLAGGLKQEALEQVRGHSVELAIPARSEIVIEGLVHPGELADEGPFGEFAGYMGPVDKRPVVRVTAITHRTDPVFYGIGSQMPPSESTTMQSISNAGQLLKILRHDLGESGIEDVWIDKTFGGLLAHAVVAVHPGPPGNGKRIGRLVASVSPCKRVTVVDHDVDIRDQEHLNWAMNSHFDPAHDTVIIDDVFVPLYMDPSVRVRDEKSEPGSKIVIDATSTAGAGEFSIPSRDIMERALETWRKAGLPEFDEPKRLKLRLDRS
jgi:UbiD family decarboxylase